MRERRSVHLLCKYAVLAKFPASIFSILWQSKGKQPSALPARFLNQTGRGPVIHLESAAFMFHMEPKTFENHRVIASRVFFSPQIGLLACPFSQP
jgi:hypothetical protein